MRLTLSGLSENADWCQYYFLISRKFLPRITRIRLRQGYSEGLRERAARQVTRWLGGSGRVLQIAVLPRDVTAAEFESRMGATMEIQQEKTPKGFASRRRKRRRAGNQPRITRISRMVKEKESTRI